MVKLFTLQIFAAVRFQWAGSSLRHLFTRADEAAQLAQHQVFKVHRAAFVS